MNTIEHRITLKAPISAIVEAITTPRGLEGWFSDKVTAHLVHGAVTLDFHEADGPFHWRIGAPSGGPSAPVKTVRWTCVAGPGSAPGTTVTFALTEKSDGRTVLDLDHEGFEDTDEKRRTCNTLWGGLMTHLKRYVETDEKRPALR